MKNFSTWLAAALITVMLPFAPAGAAGFFASSPAVPANELPIIQVAGDCHAIGQQLASQNGGTLAKAEQRGSNCVIVVLVPAKDGQRPRREEFVVPL